MGLAFKKGRRAEAVELGEDAVELGLKDDVAEAEEAEQCGGSGELKILLECDRRVFLWILCTPDHHLPHKANLSLDVFFRLPFPSFFGGELEGGESGRWLGLRLRSEHLST